MAAGCVTRLLGPFISLGTVVAVLGNKTTLPDSITDTDCSIFVAGEVDGVDTTDAFDEEDSDDGSRTECEQVLGAFDEEDDVVDVLSIHEIMSLSIIESIFSNAMDVGFGGPEVVDGEVGDLFASLRDGLFVEGDASDGVTVGGVADDAADVEGVDEAEILEFC